MWLYLTTIPICHLPKILTTGQWKKGLEATRRRTEISAQANYKAMESLVGFTNAP